MTNGKRKFLGARIRDLRRAKSLTQESLGYRTELSYKFIGEIERGIANPSIDVLGKIAEALGISLFELLSFPKEVETIKPGRVNPGPSEAFKKLFPSHDRQRARKVVRALKLLKSALRG